jgi:hypothetical protein
MFPRPRPDPPIVKALPPARPLSISRDLAASVFRSETAEPLGRSSGALDLCEALADTVSLGLQVLEVLLERCRLFVPSREPALEAERMPAAPAALVVAVVPTAAAAVLRATAAAAAVAFVAPVSAATR